MTERPSALPPPFAGLATDDSSAPALPAPVVRRFRSLVYGHFRRHARRFPWRETSDPYRILVSELMLQQTQTERVLAKYPAFLERFPTIDALAATSTRAVLEAWAGLGYNRRALALRQTARNIVAEHGGVVPSDPAALRSLPGIGPATASEIAAFAYDVPSPMIETNIRRVFLYFFFPRRRGVPDALILPLVERTLDRRQPRLWYYALMDYGVMMKKALPSAAQPDPNRRSAHYARQARFEGSDRQIRGRILRVLGGARELTREELRRRLAVCPGQVREGTGPRYGGAPRASATGVDRNRLAAILAKLGEEGFIAARGGKVRLA
jgi:A/G-specific adenine glycosylase